MLKPPAQPSGPSNKSMPRDDVQLLQAAMAKAVNAAMAVPAAERAVFVGHHLLAQLESRPPPDAGPVPKERRSSGIVEELRSLADVLTDVMNETKGKPGWPHRAVAEALIQGAPSDAAPANLKELFIHPERTLLEVRQPFYTGHYSHSTSGVYIYLQRTAKAVVLVLPVPGMPNTRA